MLVGSVGWGVPTGSRGERTGRFLTDEGFCSMVEVTVRVILLHEPWGWLQWGYTLANLNVRA